ncbi:MAG TPA: hypothetical protein PK082_01680 [Phycisphaerae bacterium]|nr:hypothetical protein [Phycisphaerae bacterium]
MKSEMKVETRMDRRRGCGWRKPGGLYLVAGGLSRDCGRLPIPLDVCPCCGGGIKPARGWTWVNGTALAATKPCHERGCSTCPLGGPIGRVGLLWIGEAFYKGPEEFLAESARQGVSRRIPAVPRDFEVGKTWVMVAHRRGIRNLDGSYTAAVFQLFRPQAVEYVVRDGDPPDKLAALAARGATLVRVQRVYDEPLLETGERAGQREKAEGKSAPRTPTSELRTGEKA